MTSASDTFDYIVVGAGSAGCVVAIRLVKDHGATVLLWEAGPLDTPTSGDRTAIKRQFCRWNEVGENVARRTSSRTPTSGMLVGMTFRLCYLTVGG
jgi:choline dehydrogenase-like flavoprotein